MFSHVMLGANDVEKSKSFYDAILGAIGYEPGVIDDNGRVFWMNKTGIFSISKPIDGEPACHGNGSTLGFSVESIDAGNAWHAAGLENGGTDCEDAPGLREGSTGSMFLAYLRDPSGNKICALHRM